MGSLLRKQNPRNKIPNDTDVNQGLDLPHRYVVKRAGGFPTDPKAFYFVLRIDNDGDDPIWTRCCRIAARALYRALDWHQHLPKLAEDLEAKCEELETPYTTVGELDDSLNHFHPIQQTTALALDITNQLQEWINNKCESHFPQAHVIIAQGNMTICIGDVAVWDSEAHNEDELNLDFCKKEYLLFIKSMREIITGQETEDADDN